MNGHNASLRRMSSPLWLAGKTGCRSQRVFCREIAGGAGCYGNGRLWKKVILVGLFNHGGCLPKPWQNEQGSWGSGKIFRGNRSGHEKDAHDGCRSLDRNRAGRARRRGGCAFQRSPAQSQCSAGGRSIDTKGGRSPIAGGGPFRPARWPSWSAPSSLRSSPPASRPSMC